MKKKINYGTKLDILDIDQIKIKMGERHNRYRIQIKIMTTNKDNEYR